MSKLQWYLYVCDNEINFSIDNKSLALLVLHALDLGSHSCKNDLRRNNDNCDILLLKCFSIVVRLLRGFNNTAFPNDLTTTPGFATDLYQFLVKC
jgi:hypothetical protein